MVFNVGCRRVMSKSTVVDAQGGTPHYSGKFDRHALAMFLYI